MTIDDFKIGMKVKHEEYGEGEVHDKNPANSAVEVGFDNWGFYRLFYINPDCYEHNISELTIIDKPIVSMKQAREEALQNFSGRTLEFKEPISKMETTEEKLCKPITKENINEVLEYNGWKYDGENYNHYQSTKDGFVVDYTILLADVKFKFNYYLRSEYGNIHTDDFDEFLTFVQKRIELKPIPKTTEEETMQEFEPITKENINEVLEYNGWIQNKKVLETQCPYISFDKNDDSFTFIDGKYSYIKNLTSDKRPEVICIINFDKFIKIMQEYVELKPLPKKSEFDFEQYLLENGFVTKEESTWVIIKNHKLHFGFFNHFELLADTTTFAKTKENADILIAAAKLLEGLK